MAELAVRVDRRRSGTDAGGRRLSFFLCFHRMGLHYLGRCNLCAPCFSEEEQGWTQAEAARHLGITQPRVSRLLRGKVEDFSLDMLLTLAARAGLHTELRISN